MDLLSDWYSELIKKSENITRERINNFYFLAVPTPVVELIFLICLSFGQPDEVRYLSIELFDRFVRQHFLDLLNKMWDDKNLSASEKWKTVEQKLHSQTSLRMLSCVQLASKFVIHPKIIRPKEIQNFLKAEGKAYTLPTIVASEMRVWKTLNLQINIPTVLTYVEILLEQLKTCSTLPLSYETIHSRVVFFIDVAYLHHHEIYRKLFYLSTGRWEPTTKEKEEFLTTECNVLYRATAILALSITFTSRDLGLCESVNSELSHLTQLPPQDIKVLANIMRQIVLL